MVQPNAEEEHAAKRAEAYVRSTAGARVPPIRFVWSNALTYCNGSTVTVRAPSPVAPVAVLLKTGRGFEATFLTAVHELTHTRDVNSGQSYTRAPLEGVGGGGRRRGARGAMEVVIPCGARRAAHVREAIWSARCPPRRRPEESPMSHAREVWTT